MAINNFSDLLKSFMIKKTNKTTGETYGCIEGSSTNTRIGDKELKISGGDYCIHPSKWEDFMKKYYQAVFVQGKKEYLTEKQLIEKCPIYVDFDFRYDTSITTRQHNSDHIIDMVMLYANEIEKLVAIRENVPIDVYVMEKPEVNILEDKTKDGIHMLFGMTLHREAQIALRNRVMPQLACMWDDLPITNSWEDVLDEGISNGTTNTQMYGSRKPNNLAYRVSHHFTLTWDKGDWELTTNPIEQFSIEKHFLKLSTRYTDNPEFTFKDVAWGDIQRENYKKSSGKKSTNKDSTKSKEASADSGYDTPVLDEEKLNIEQEEGLELLKATNVEYFTEFKYWKPIMIGTGNTFPKEKAREVAHFYSKKTTRDNYDADALDKLLDAKLYGCKIGTLRHYCKLSNEETYMKIQLKYKTDYDNSHLSLAEQYLKLIDDDVIYVEDKVYIYEGRLWICDYDKMKLKSNMTQTLKKFYSECFARENKKVSVLMLLKSGQEEAEAEATQEKINTLKSTINKIEQIIKKVKDDGFQTKVMSQVVLYLQRPKISFDTIKPHYFVFNNKAFDFQTRTEVILKKEDYITYSTKNDFIKPKQEDIDALLAIIKQILPRDDVRACYLSVLRSCCIGIKEHKFIMANGGGRNGKGLISQLMAVMLGSDYFYKGNALTITEKAKTGANPEVANMDKKRMVLFAEPEENASVQLGIVKELTGEESINARQCFSNKTTTQLTATIILEVNGKIKVNGKINEAALERWTNIDFPNCFTSKSYLVDNITKFHVNTTYTTDAWREKMRNALFHILFNNKSEQIEISKKMSDETEEYMLDNDIFLSWFKKFYVIDENTTDVLKMADLTHKIMEDEQFWKSLTKKQQREEYSKKALITKVKENIKLKQYYFERKKINKIDYFSVITNIREKTEKEMNDEDIVKDVDPEMD